MTRRARWWLLPVIVATVLPVTACSSDKAEKCEAAFTAAASTVEGVASAEWDGNFQFGGGWVRSDIVLEATTEDEAVTVMDELLRAFAASPDLEDGWSTPQKYTTEDHLSAALSTAHGHPSTPDPDTITGTEQTDPLDDPAPAVRVTAIVNGINRQDGTRWARVLADPSTQVRKAAATHGYLTPQFVWTALATDPDPTV